MGDRKIKILYLITSPQIGGAEKQFFELATRIDKNNFDFLVCTIKSEKDGLLLEKLREKGVETESLNVNSKWSFYKLFKFYSLLKKERPDILQSFLFFDNILARIFGKLAGVPVIVSGQRNVETRRSQFRNFVDGITISLADVIVSNSEAGKKMLMERERVSGDRVRVIYNGVEIPTYSKQLTTNNGSYIKNIGFVGHLTKQKGVEYLLRAYSQLTANGQQQKTVLYIVGDGPERDGLENLSRELGIEDGVHFLGHKENAWEYIKDFDVLVLPSLWEGLPNVVMEAMAQGVPVVASNVGGVPELIEDAKTGFLVDPKNPQELSEKIKHVLDLPEGKRKKIGENASRSVEEKFSIEKMVKEHEELYQKINKTIKQ